MKLKDCTHGKIVTMNGLIGMIVGIGTLYDSENSTVRNDPTSARPLVQFAGEFKPRLVHQGNIEPYKGDL